MSTLTNASAHPVVLGSLTVLPGEVIDDFDDKEAEKLKDSIFVKAGWITLETSKAKAKADKSE